jgi:hypothetical protein
MSYRMNVLTVRCPEMLIATNLRNALPNEIADA